MLIVVEAPGEPVAVNCKLATAVVLVIGVVVPYPDILTEPPLILPGIKDHPEGRPPPSTEVTFITLVSQVAIKVKPPIPFPLVNPEILPIVMLALPLCPLPISIVLPPLTVTVADAA